MSTVLVDEGIEVGGVGLNSCGSFISAIGIEFEVVEDVVSEYRIWKGFTVWFPRRCNLEELSDGRKVVCELTLLHR